MSALNQYLAQLDEPIAFNVRDDSKLDHSLNYTPARFIEYMDAVRTGATYYYGETDAWLYEALRQYPIVGMDVLLIGSANPWYEAICLVFGAATVTVSEYGDRPFVNEAIKYVKPESLNRRFDACLNISSVEHDGLGRYGDPIDANGDLKTMTKLVDLVRPNGLHFLAVPVGRDLTVFNVHRIYGKRLIKLCERWNILDQFGLTANWWEQTINTVEMTPYQPVLVLMNGKHHERI